MKIIILVQDITVLTLIQKTLKEHSSERYIPYFATTHKEALKKYTLYKPDLIVIDINQNPPFYIPFINQIKLEFLPRIPIIVIGNLQDPEMAEYILNLEPVVLVKKPISEEQFKLALYQASEKIEEVKILKMIQQSGVSITWIIKNIKKWGKTIPVKLVNGDLENLIIEDCQYFFIEFAVLRVKLESGDYKILAQSLNNFEAKLNREQFYRISKQVIINKDYINNYSIKNKKLTMKDGAQFIVSRRKSKDLPMFLKKNHNQE